MLRSASALAGRSLNVDVVDAQERRMHDSMLDGRAAVTAAATNK